MTSVAGQTADEFLHTSGLGKLVQEIYAGVCKERPDDVNAYIVEHLMVCARQPPLLEVPLLEVPLGAGGCAFEETSDAACCVCTQGSYRKSAKASTAHQSGALKSGFGQWAPVSNARPTNKGEMMTYLEDSRLASLLQRVVEKAVMLRPTNVVAMTMDIVCGTDAHLLDTEEAERAAQKLQATRAHPPSDLVSYPSAHPHPPLHSPIPPDAIRSEPSPGKCSISLT